MTALVARLAAALVLLALLPLAQCASGPRLEHQKQQQEEEDGVQLRCLGRSLQDVLQDAPMLSSSSSQARTGAAAECQAPRCDFWWHRRHSPLARRYLQLIRQHQHSPPDPARKLVFSSALHDVPFWGTQNKHINFAYSLAVATGRQLIFDPEDDYQFVPRSAAWPHRTINFYMEHQEACALRRASQEGAAGGVPWLDFRASQPDSHIPRDQDVFAGPQPVAWYLSNHGLRDFLKNASLLTELYGSPMHYWWWYPRTLPEPVPQFEDMDATLKLSAWRTALATYAFCPRPWVLQEAQCRLRALGLQPNKYIAMHIRRGDKVNNTAGRKFPAEGRLIPADHFFERARWVRRMSLEPDCCNVAYVAFDVQSDLPEIQAAARKYGFKLVYDPHEERRGHPLFMKDWSQGRNVARVHPDGTVFETQLGDVKNTLAFVEAYTLIGADQSTYARFARTLRGLDSSDLVAGLSLAQNNLYGEWKPLR